MLLQTYLPKVYMDIHLLGGRLSLIYHLENCIWCNEYSPTKELTTMVNDVIGTTCNYLSWELYAMVGNLQEYILSIQNV